MESGDIFRRQKIRLVFSSLELGVAAWRGWRGVAWLLHYLLTFRIVKWNLGKIILSCYIVRMTLSVFITTCLCEALRFDTSTGSYPFPITWAFYFLHGSRYFVFLRLGCCMTGSPRSVSPAGATTNPTKNYDKKVEENLRKNWRRETKA